MPSGSSSDSSSSESSEKSSSSSNLSSNKKSVGGISYQNSVDSNIMIQKLPFNALERFILRGIPLLTNSLSKGQNGRIAVVGGSKDYTGAPFYAASAALQFGADLASVFCAEEAAIPIKCYSPELMVSPYYRDASLPHGPVLNQSVDYGSNIRDIELQLNSKRVSALVIGPGLGRNPHVAQMALRLIKMAVSLQVPLVIDADGIWVVQQEIDAIRNYDKCILTPNGQEFNRLLQLVRSQLSSKLTSTTTDDLESNLDLKASRESIVGDGTWTESQGAGEGNETIRNKALGDIELADLLKDGAEVDDLTLVRGVSRYLGVAILKKGALDIIASPLSNSAFEIDESGAPRRCGGQGDILAGALGVSLHWYLQNVVVKTEQTAVKASSLVSPNPTIASGGLDNTTFFTGAATASASFPSSLNVRNDPIVLASVLASTIVRRAAKKSFSNFGRSSTAPQILNLIGKVFARDIDSKIELLAQVDNDNNDIDIASDITDSRKSDIEMARLGQHDVEMAHLSNDKASRLTEANVEAHNKNLSDSDSSSKDSNSSEDDDSSDDSSL